tara:strand:+ start:292 stop:741 length:450 start_codon:yes stop_codon:yes gene_type:complete
MTSDHYITTYNKALDLISRREHSAFELKQKLYKRYPDQDSEIEEVIHKLIENKLLDDARFAEMYTIARSKKGFGPKKIELELVRKHVKSEYIFQALQVIEDWTQVLNDVLIKKYHNQPIRDYKDLMQRKKFVYNRGFSQDQIESVLSEP